MTACGSAFFKRSQPMNSDPQWKEYNFPLDADGSGCWGSSCCRLLFPGKYINGNFYFFELLLALYLFMWGQLQHRACLSTAYTLYRQDARVQINLPSVLCVHVLQVQAWSMRASWAGKHSKHGFSSWGWSTLVLYCDVYLARNGAPGSVFALSLCCIAVVRPTSILFFF